MNNLAVIRKQRHKTQAELAAEIGISTDHLQRLETNRRQASLPTAEKLARALSLSLDDLLRALRTEPTCFHCGARLEDCACRYPHPGTLAQKTHEALTDAAPDPVPASRRGDWYD